MSKPVRTIKRIPKADVDTQRAEREIRRALGQIRAHAGTSRDAVVRGLKELAKDVGITIA